ncbi:hypothetical protein BH20CHL6_BH20CHL6_14710 [soil metagenome]
MRGTHNGGMPEPTVRAAIDTGSNSVHLLVARVIDAHELSPLADTSVLIPLGDAVDRHGRITEAEGQRVLAAITRFVALAEEHGAVSVTLLGTEPLRRAADSGALASTVWAATGRPLHVVSHDQEGLLTVIGVTHGRAPRDEVVIIDIGGGSTEYVQLTPGKDPRPAALATGSSRLARRFLEHDPPLPDELNLLRNAVRELMRATVPELRPVEIVLVGGTVTNLLKLFPASADRRLTAERLENALTMLLAEPADAVAARFRTSSRRASLLPAGAALVEGFLTRFGASEARVSQASLREGTVLAVSRAGDAWCEQLLDLARGW